MMLKVSVGNFMPDVLNSGMFGCCTSYLFMLQGTALTVVTPSLAIMVVNVMM